MHDMKEIKSMFSRVGLGMLEGVGEDSRHRFRHVDIQVGSCIYFSVIVSMTCALRWGVTQVG